MTHNFRIFKTVSRTDCIIEPFHFVSLSFLILAIIFSRNPTAIQVMNFRTAFMQWILQGGYWLRLRRRCAFGAQQREFWLGLCSRIYLQIHKLDSNINTGGFRGTRYGPGNSIRRVTLDKRHKQKDEVASRG